MIRLYEHNRTAYASAAEMMEAAGKAAVVHPTGTGKSYGLGWFPSGSQPVYGQWHEPE